MIFSNSLQSTPASPPLKRGRIQDTTPPYSPSTRRKNELSSRGSPYSIILNSFQDLLRSIKIDTHLHENNNSTILVWSTQHFIALFLIGMKKMVDTTFHGDSTMKMLYWEVIMSTSQQRKCVVSLMVHFQMITPNSFHFHELDPTLRELYKPLLIMRVCLHGILMSRKSCEESSMDHSIFLLDHESENR